MSMLNRREFKELLTEWRSNFINEVKVVSLDELTSDMFNSESYNEEDIKFLEEFWNNPSHQFISKYSQVIKNDISKGEPIEHILSDIKTHYHKIYQSASPKSKSEIGLGNIFVDDLRKQIDDRTSFNSRETRQQCPYKNERPVVGSYQDFDVIYSGSDWIVIEPKTTFGSIAWAHGKPNGEEETNQRRRVGWCTATSSSNNMFKNYAGNLHMFYLIKSNYDQDMSPNRRLCLSYIIDEDGEARLQWEDGATVNAENMVVAEDVLHNIISQNIFETINNALSGRTQTSLSEMYSKASLSQILRIIRQMKSQDIDDELMKEEIASYIVHTKSKAVKKYFLIENIDDDVIDSVLDNYQCPVEIIKIIADNSSHDRVVAHALHLTNKFSEDELIQIYDKWQNSVHVAYSLSQKANLPGYILSNFAFPISSGSRRGRDHSTAFNAIKHKNLPLEAMFKIARENYTSIDDNNAYLRKISLASNLAVPAEVINILLKDKDEDVRLKAEIHPNKIKFDLSNNSLDMIKEKSYDYKNVLVQDKSTSPDVIAILVNDNNSTISQVALMHNNCPSHVLEKFASHNSFTIRKIVASHENTPVETLAILVNDDYHGVKTSAMSNPNYLKNQTKVESRYYNLKKYIRAVLL